MSKKKISIEETKVKTPEKKIPVDETKFKTSEKKRNLCEPSSGAWNTPPVKRLFTSPTSPVASPTSPTTVVVKGNFCNFIFYINLVTVDIEYLIVSSECTKFLFACLTII